MREWDWLRAVHVIGAAPGDGQPLPDQLNEFDENQLGSGWTPPLLVAAYNPDGMTRG